MGEFRASEMMETQGPGIWDALRGDPTLDFDRRAIELLVTDQQRWSHRYLRPPVRVLSRVAVGFITLIKRILPFQFSNHDLLDRLGIWFMSRFVSEEGGELLLRHFVIETNVLAFIARNADETTEEPTLRPATLEELDENAVIVHDLNLYAVLAGLEGKPLQSPNDRTRPLDFSMLAVPEIAPSPKRRLFRMDLETGMALMNIMFCLLTTTHEYRRAVHSLQFDESLLACVAELTGDQVFRSWKPAGYIPIVRTNRDVPRDLFAHAVIHEYIHARLLKHAPKPGPCGTGDSCPALERALVEAGQ